MKKLSKNDLKRIFGGSGAGGCETDEEAQSEIAPICTSCSIDSECTSGRVCRGSRSCIELKVCARPYLC